MKGVVRTAASTARGGTLASPPIARMVMGLLGGALLLIGLGPSRPVWAGAQDWNDQKIQWRPYEDGLAEAKKQHKPVCLIFYTTWCPHCTNYSRVFQDVALVEKSKAFIMIRVDKDQQPAVSGRYRPDGEYIPRTYFLSSDGTLDESLTAQRPKYKYFYDERNAASIIAGMDRAVAKLSQQ
jgi:protein-disulfide reductase (glutathione)